PILNVRWRENCCWIVGSREGGREEVKVLVDSVTSSAVLSLSQDFLVDSVTSSAVLSLSQDFLVDSVTSSAVLSLSQDFLVDSVTSSAVLSLSQDFLDIKGRRILKVIYSP
ncbi:hypothetical protein BgiBS90_004151, partial [Biomphalaria glabrata]